MPALANSRQEQFAQLVAMGKAPAEAYAAVGYAQKAAYTCGPRLLKTPRVRARVTELHHTVEESVVTHIVMDREKVLAGISQIAYNGDSESARLRAFELLGKAMGMFTARAEQSAASGGTIQALDLSKFTTEELEFFERIHKRIRAED
jgi:hypothetical protein